MSLNWNIEKCANTDFLKSEAEWPITEALIWTTLFIDIGEITASNVKRFYERAFTFELLHGPILKDRPLTIRDVRRRIGLTTNVTTKTDADWRKRVQRMLAEKAKKAAEDFDSDWMMRAGEEQ